VKPFVPLLHSGRSQGWRTLGASPPEEALPVASEDLLLAHIAHTQARAAAEVVSPPEAEPVPPEPDPELMARIEELEGRDATREAEHAAALRALEAQRKELQAAIERVGQVARAVDGARGAIVEELRTGIGGVILEAARRMAGHALHADPSLVETMVEEAARALGREGLVVRVAPQDAALLAPRLGAMGVVVREDPSVDAGAICEGPSGRIDASLASATSAIASVLAQWRAAT
jgi:flagellar biosynthesis/type III secretory pathway protein FliH